MAGAAGTGLPAPKATSCAPPGARYSYAGSHMVLSGFTSVLLAGDIEPLRAAAAGQRPPRKIAASDAEGGSWLAFLSHVSTGQVLGLARVPLPL